jgi:TP901-1 family phage major tail protein
MAPIKSNDIRLRLNLGTLVSPTWVYVACEDSLSWDLSTENIDISTKCSQGFSDGDLGNRSFSVSSGGVFIEGDPGMAHALDSWVNGTKVMASLVYGNVMLEATGMLESISHDAPVNDVLRYSISFMSQGVVTVTYM